MCARASSRDRQRLIFPRGDSPEVFDSGSPRKRRRTEEAHFHESERNWSAFEQEVLQFEAQYITKKGKFAFGFVEGPLVRALRSGDWYVLHVSLSWRV
jgi:midasin (ATPase involved in ribosome maturation)